MQVCILLSTLQTIAAYLDVLKVQAVEEFWIWTYKTKVYIWFSKGQLISKAIYGLLTSSKKQTDEFDLFSFLLFTTNKSNQICSFFGRS